MRSILFASLTFLPTRLGMVVSRPWMAMRIAVMALKNAADVSFAGLVGTVSPNLRDEPALLFQDLQASSLTTPCA